MLTLVLPLNVAAQDDLYFVPTKANVKKTSENYGMPKDTYYCDIISDVEDFEAMPVTATTGAADVEGKFASWTFTKCNVAAPGTDTKADGTHSVQMKLPSQFTTSATYYDAYQISAKVFNPGSATIKLAMQYSTDDGASWIPVKVMGETIV